MHNYSVRYSTAFILPTYSIFIMNCNLPDLRSGSPSWWLYAGGPTRSHPEHGR